MILTAQVLGLRLGWRARAVVFAVVVGVSWRSSSREEAGRERAPSPPPRAPRQAWSRTLLPHGRFSSCNWGASNQAVGFFAVVYRVHWPLTAALLVALFWMMSAGTRRTGSGSGSRRPGLRQADPRPLSSAGSSCPAG
jgi:hypothetical protein